MDKTLERTLKDLIEIPEVKLVIELDDAERSPQEIIRTLVFTDEINEGLKTILSRLSQTCGCGIFIKGNFGCGKSHFLSYLYLLLTAQTANKDIPKLGKAVKFSLVKYPASRSLEDILLTNLGYQGERLDREKMFNNIINTATVVIIDELSEFLRSKPTPAAFYEDIRFLQFLGEFSFHHPLWVIASLQEWIEETGHISSTIFNRIKDRYPLRINLTSSHIEDIIDKRIILKKEPAMAAMEKVFSELAQFYPHLNLKFSEFSKTYPLHPWTVRFLAGLTPIFSQQRGVIQFVHTEAKKILDKPVETLITPEVIFDHFEQRIREIPEYSRLVRIVYDYYKLQIGRIFPEAMQKLALKAVKILILTEISPLEKRKSDKDIAELLLPRISTLNSGINYEYVREGVLLPLVAQQMYVVRDKEQYFIDLQLDEGLRIKTKIKELRQKFADRNYLFGEICNYFNLAYLPLKDLLAGRKYKFVWQNSLRECVAMILFGETMRREEIERMLEALNKNIDGFCIFVSPFLTEKKWLSALKDTYQSPFLASLIFWLPRQLNGEEINFLEEFAAKQILQKEVPQLANEIKRDESAFRELISEIYFSGEIVYGSGKKIENPKEIGYLPVEKLFSHLFDQSLSELHPYHYQVMPRVDYFSSHHLSSLFSGFIRPGKITFEEAEKKGLLPYLKGLLEPLGIVKKRGGTFLISLDAENELVAHFLNLVSNGESMDVLSRQLRKGKWGLAESQIYLLTSAFLAAGLVVPYREDEALELRDITQLQTGEITKIKPGRILSPALLGYLHHGKFIWGEVEDTPTPLTQKMMWKAVEELLRKSRKMLEEVGNFSNRYREYALFRNINIDSELLNRLGLFARSLALSSDPVQGLEKILSAFQANPQLEEDLRYLEKIHHFFNEGFQLLNKYYLYLAHPQLEISGELGDLKVSLQSDIEEFLRFQNQDFLPINEKWEKFYEDFTNLYRENHRSYYQSPVFGLRKELEEKEEIVLLKKISLFVNSVTFKWDWWEIKKELEALPPVCPYDLPGELFLNPICRCGYKIGEEAAESRDDFLPYSQQGIVNFIRQLQLPENRERLDSYFLSMRDTDKKQIARKVDALLNITLKNISTSLLLPLLTEETLKEIEQALSGKWKIKKIKLGDFTGKINGRKLKYNELKEIFADWAGREEETIVWIKEDGQTAFDLVSANLTKYGIQGEKILNESGLLYSETVEEIEEKLKDTAGLERIKWSSFTLEQLLNFVNQEKLETVKKKLREEIFYRLWDKPVKELAVIIEDELTNTLISLIALSQNAEKYRGGELFKNIISPFSLLIQKIKDANHSQEKIDREIQLKLEDKLTNLLKIYEGSADKLDGIKDLESLKKQLTGVVVVFDGLRADLWLMLREEFVRHGFTVKDDVFQLFPPSTTANFRQFMGIEEKGEVAGKSYILLKWAERNAAKKGLKSFLKDEAKIKFLHFNFIDVKIHSSCLDPYPLYKIIKSELVTAIIPLLKEIPSFTIVSDHGFTDTGRLKDRYTHGGTTLWETIVPLAQVKSGGA